MVDESEIYLVFTSFRGGFIRFANKLGSFANKPASFANKPASFANKPASFANKLLYRSELSAFRVKIVVFTTFKVFS